MNLKDLVLLRKTKFSSDECTFPVPDKMQWRLWIDDTFLPPSTSYDSGWIVAKTTKMIKLLIKKHGIPFHIHYGIIHASRHKPSSIAKGILKWAVKTKQKVIGNVTFSVSSSNSNVEAFKVKKHYDTFYKTAYDIEQLKDDIKGTIKYAVPNNKIKSKKKTKKKTKIKRL